MIVCSTYGTSIVIICMAVTTHHSQVGGYTLYISFVFVVRSREKYMKLVFRLGAGRLRRTDM